MPRNFNKWCDGCGNQTLVCDCKPCEVCSGTGKDEQTKWLCKRCNGIGKHNFKDRSPDCKPKEQTNDR